MSTHDATVSLGDAFTGGTVTLTNPETGEDMTVSLGPSAVAEYRRVFEGDR